MEFVWMLIAGAFFLSFIFMSFYPFSFKSKIKKGARQKKAYGTKIKVSKIRYATAGINCVFFLSIPVMEWINMLKDPRYIPIDNKVIIIALCIVMYYLFKLLFKYPRMYFMLSKDGVHYHNGIREIRIDNIKCVTRWFWSSRFEYFWLILKTDRRKWAFLDILLFSEPEELWYIISDLSEFVLQ